MKKVLSGNGGFPDNAVEIIVSGINRLLKKPTADEIACHREWEAGDFRDEYQCLERENKILKKTISALEAEITLLKKDNAELKEVADDLLGEIFEASG
ncbi:MAG: hypothetical protein WC848_02725 [Parcubacteria group bacterium]|jgi:hypothetical protein